MSSSPIMTLGGYNYDLDLVLKIGKTGIMASIKETELNDGTEPMHQVTLSEEFKGLDDEAVIFFKQSGKFTVISGKNKIETIKSGSKYKGEIPGHIITSVALKKARLIEETEDDVVVDTPAYNTRPTHRPPREHRDTYRRDGGRYYK